MAGKSRIKVDFDKIYESNSCGPFKIIQDLGRDERSRLFVRVKFINTGTEKDVRYDIAMDGKVMDELFGVDFNKIYNSKYYGPYKIIAYIGRNHDSRKIVRIKFLDTGYEYNTALQSAINGDVKDHTVDYHDRVIYSYNENDYNDIIISILKERWKGMMDRCYNSECSSFYKYGKIGVKVCDRWLDANNYISDMPLLKNYDKFYVNPQMYQIDKDFLQFNVPKNERIYSPETCLFLSLVDNANLSIKMNHKEQYYGVRNNSNGTFSVIFSTEGQKRTYGTYNNYIAALNEYNYYYLQYANFELIPLLNEGMELMDHEEALKYLVH